LKLDPVRLRRKDGWFGEWSEATFSEGNEHKTCCEQKVKHCPFARFGLVGSFGFLTRCSLVLAHSLGKLSLHPILKSNFGGMERSYILEGKGDG